MAFRNKKGKNRLRASGGGRSVRYSKRRLIYPHSLWRWHFAFAVFNNLFSFPNIIVSTKSTMELLLYTLSRVSITVGHMLQLNLHFFQRFPHTACTDKTPQVYISQPAPHLNLNPTQHTIVIARMPFPPLFPPFSAMFHNPLKMSSVAFPPNPCMTRPPFSPPPPFPKNPDLPSAFLFGQSAYDTAKERGLFVSPFFFFA